MQAFQKRTARSKFATRCLKKSASRQSELLEVVLFENLLSSGMLGEKLRCSAQHVTEICSMQVLRGEIQIVLLISGRCLEDHRRPLLSFWSFSDTVDRGSIGAYPAGSGLANLAVRDSVESSEDGSRQPQAYRGPRCRLQRLRAGGSPTHRLPTPSSRFSGICVRGFCLAFSDFWSSRVPK